MPRLVALLWLAAWLVFGPADRSGGAIVSMARTVDDDAPTVPPQPAEAVASLAARDASDGTDATDDAPRGLAPVRMPASAGRYADPAILLEGNTYYLYATRTGQLDIPVSASTDLRTWSPPVNALPALPGWAERGRTWAPSVVRRGEQFVMWYTVRHRESGRMCISVATAMQPVGPFTDATEQPAVCQIDRGGSIDPDVFVNTEGDPYLVWKSEDNVLGQPTSLWSAPLDASATRVGPAVLLLTRNAEWQGLIIEGPAMLRADAGYLLFYGANAWATPSAAIGFARCDSPLGPCREQSLAGPWLRGDSTVLGPSGPQFFRSATGAQLMAYHAWDQCVGRGPACRRVLFIDEVRLHEGRPLLAPAAGSAAR